MGHISTDHGNSHPRSRRLDRASRSHLTGGHAGEAGVPTGECAVPLLPVVRLSATKSGNACGGTLSPARLACGHQKRDWIDILHGEMPATLSAEWPGLRRHRPDLATPAGSGRHVFRDFKRLGQGCGGAVGPRWRGVGGAERRFGIRSSAAGWNAGVGEVAGVGAKGAVEGGTRVRGGQLADVSGTRRRAPLWVREQRSGHGEGCGVQVTNSMPCCGGGRAGAMAGGCIGLDPPEQGISDRTHVRSPHRCGYDFVGLAGLAQHQRPLGGDQYFLRHQGLTVCRVESCPLGQGFALRSTAVCMVKPDAHGLTPRSDRIPRRSEHCPSPSGFSHGDRPCHPGRSFRLWS
jgi:hypothetical protein